MVRRIDRDTNDVAVVKKYANRRLYNTRTSSYVTLDELSQMVREAKEFVVYDAKSGEDITRSVLTQIILEEDGKGRNLLPISFLRQLIGLYDDSLHAVVPRYLEMSMENFLRQQDQMRAYMEGTFGRFFPLPGAMGGRGDARPTQRDARNPTQRDARNPIEDMARQNLAMFQNAARMLNPFVEPGEDAAGPAVASETDRALSAEVETLRAQVDALQRRIEKLGENNDA